MKAQVMKQQEDRIVQEYFNEVFFTTISSFEYIAFKCSNNSKYSMFQNYCYFNKAESIDEAINKAILQYQNLKSMLDSLKNEGKTVNFPVNVDPKKLEEEINSWISEINRYDASLCDNCLKTMKEIVTENRNIEKASEYCYKHAHEKSKGECSAYVRNALNNAGFDFPTENFHAYKFYKDENGVNHLELRGFKEIKLEEGFKNKMDGDIVVEEPKGKHKYGHIQIYNSKHGQWVSDFKQRGEAMVHSSDIGVRHYYRYCPKFPCLKFQRQKKAKKVLENHFLDEMSGCMGYDRYNNSSSSYYYRDNNSITSFKINDRVSVGGNLEKSSDGNVGFKFNVGFSIPCIIF
jgi:hypothetical protein